MKKKTLLSSILTIVLCLSLISGSTYALFTSEQTVSIGVTAGKVSLVAKIDDASVELYSRDEKQSGLTFANLGTASFNTEYTELTLTNVTPGDKVEFDIDVTNYSNVAIQYRVTWTVSSTDTDHPLSDVLVATADGVKVTEASTTWTPWNIPTDLIAGDTKTIPVVVELPLWVGNDYQEKTATITFRVEAVQGNATDLYDNPPVQPNP